MPPDVAVVELIRSMRQAARRPLFVNWKLWDDSRRQSHLHSSKTKRAAEKQQQPPKDPAQQQGKKPQQNSPKAAAGKQKLPSLPQKTPRPKEYDNKCWAEVSRHVVSAEIVVCFMRTRAPLVLCQLLLLIKRFYSGALSLETFCV